MENAEQFDTRSPSVGRRLRTDVASEVLDRVILGYGAAAHREGFTSAQLGRMVADLCDVSERTVQRHLRRLEASGYVEVIDGTGGSYRPTEAGRLRHARMMAMESSRDTT